MSFSSDEQHSRRSSFTNNGSGSDNSGFITSGSVAVDDAAATAAAMLSSSLPLSSNSESVSGTASNNSSSNALLRNQIRYSFQKKPFIIGVAGGTASGKSTVCSKIIEKLGPIDPTSIYLSHEKRVVRISQDSFYRKLGDEDRIAVQNGQFNFDHPSAFDVELMVKTLRDLCEGKMVRVPVYDYSENKISDQEEVIYPADVILFEGLLLFYFPDLRKLFHMKIFVDTDPDTRLARRVTRDVKERHRDLNFVLTQYLKFVKPSFEEFCLPSKKYADIVVPRGPDNEVAVDLIVTQVRSVFDPAMRHQSIKFQCSIEYDGQPLSVDATDAGDDNGGPSTPSPSPPPPLLPPEQDQISVDSSEAATTATTTSDFSEPLLMMADLSSEDDEEDETDEEKKDNNDDDDVGQSLSGYGGQVPRSRPVQICAARTKDYFDDDDDDADNDRDLGIHGMYGSTAVVEKTTALTEQSSDADAKNKNNHHNYHPRHVNAATKIFWVASR